MSELLNISGIGPKKLSYLEKISIKTLSDALFFYPRGYEDRTIFNDTKTVTDGMKTCIIGMIASKSKNTKLRSGLEISKIRAVDDFSSFEINLFNQKYLSDSLKIGETYVFYGVAQVFGNKITLNSPSVELYTEKSSRILPIYPLTKGISQNDIRKICFYALNNIQPVELIPQELLEKYKLPEIKKALIKIHFPKTLEDVMQAKRRVSFENLFLYTLKLEFLKSRRKGIDSFRIKTTDYSDMDIPFTLTGAQLRSVNECLNDMESGLQLNRLLQGDVGSGKTIVALILSYVLIKNKKQVAFMVPTEILATQHYDDFLSFNLPIKIALLTGSTSAKNKRIIKQGLKDGSIDIVIGTHAIISDDVDFFDLGLCIVDEQHRFGVLQRAKLLSKGDNAHILVMSATPIPRTLALILYSDLDLSIIDELPKGRIPVKTLLLDESSRKKVNSFIKKQIDQKKQAYIVCPLIDENETLELKDATNYYENIKALFKDYTVALIHGKMKPAEKDTIMDNFKKGCIDILISTTVIEVGVNVPNATIMVIENAERFGLSSLHQLRGRVGRSSEQSYCILISKDKSERLAILEQTNDGFLVSKEDLNLRGSGDFFGTRQHGQSDLSLTDLDVKVLKYAHLEAQNILNKSQNLENYPNLQKYIVDNLHDNMSNIFN